MLRYLAPALLSLFVFTGCSNDSSESPADSSESQVRTGTAARSSVRGLRFGDYKNRETPAVGQFVTLSIKGRTAGLARRFNGVYSGVFKDASGERQVSGNIQIVRKYVQQPSQASGRFKTDVVKFFAADGSTVFHEARYMYVGNTGYFTTVDATRTTELDLVRDAAGNEPFELQCTLTELHDDGVFEESLSEDEYPDISIVEEEGKFSVGIGAASFDDGDDNTKVIVQRRSGKDIDVKIEVEGGYYRVAVQNKKGTVELNEGELRKIADFSCQ